MKRAVFLCLCICVAIGSVACAGTRTVAPVPTAKAQVTVPSLSVSPGVSSPTAASSSANEAAVAMSYYQAISAQNYQLAFTFFAANASGPDGQKLTWQAFLQLARTMENEGGPVTHFSIGVSQSMIVMTIYRQKIGPYHAHLQMQQEGTAWKIMSIDRV